MIKKIKDLILSDRGKVIIRHTLTAIGGLVVGLGVIDESALEALIGAILTIYGVVLSFIDKENKEN
jgi:hypothetical protein